MRIIIFNYRVYCSSWAWVGTTLAARYMNAVKLWEHDAFFDYVDSWMREDDPFVTERGICKLPAEESKAADKLVTQMCKAYRVNKH